MSAINLPSDQPLLDDRVTVVAGQPPSPPAETKASPHATSAASRLAGALLAVYSDTLDDLEKTRIATENRIRALRDDKDLAGTPEEARLQALADGLRTLEHDAELRLAAALRMHPLGQWAKNTIGVGAKQGGRLIAAIGDPYWNARDERPRRGPAELMAYCGYHVLHPGQNIVGTQAVAAGVDPSHATDQRRFDVHHAAVGGVAPRRARGQRANWNSEAKMRAFLIAESAVKTGVRKLPGCDDTHGYDVAGRKAITPLGAEYLDGRAKYADAVHHHACPQCGPKGKPAQPETPLSDGHQHARALRLVAKAVLRDLFLEAKRLHEGDQP